MFKPASDQGKKYLKILVYGESGVGKTWFGLMAQGRKAVIDTENGTAFYGKKFKFDVLKTKTYSDVKKAISLIEKQPNKYDVLIIDPITNIYQTLKDAAYVVAERRSKDKDNVALTHRDWGIVKQKFGSLITALCNLPCHVVITGWSKDIFEGEGNSMKKIGTRADADKKIEYQPDVKIHLTTDKSGNRFGIVEKDRTMTYQTGQRVPDISFNAFLPAVSPDGMESRLQTEEEASEEDADIDSNITVDTMLAITTKWKQLGYDGKLIDKQLKKSYGVVLHHLTEKQGKEFLYKLESLKPKQDNHEQPEQKPQEKKQSNRYAALFAAGTEKNLSQDDVKQKVYAKFDITSLTKLSDSELTEVTQWIKSTEQDEPADTKKVS
jgi:hypothetical protein